MKNRGREQWFLIVERVLSVPGILTLWFQRDQGLAAQDLHQPAAATSLPGNMAHGPVAAVPP